MTTVTKSRVLVAIVLAVAAGTIAVAQDAVAQLTPLNLDHYKIYELDPTNFKDGEPVGLTDQFDEYEFRIDGPFRLGVPTQKNHSNLFFPDLHHTWYRVRNLEPQPSRLVVYENQFGEGVVEVGDPSWLLAPAAKNSPSGEPPAGRNHFLCYEALGGGLGVFMNLINQLTDEDITLLDPKLFCNPVKKLHFGNFSDIVDDQEHLVCYDFDPHGILTGIPLALADQFLITQGQPFESVLLCLPSLKTGVTPTDESTWGKVKSIYR